MRPTLVNYITTREEFESNSNDVFNFLLKGHVEQAIHEVYPLKDVARAHEDLEGRKTTGKLLFSP
jgi:NADPH:quinone reductase-like Zn-dependent oxidoreductase